MCAHKGAAGRHVQTPADGHALREQFLDAARAAELGEGGQRVRDEARPECTQAQLRHRAVVQDLGADVHVLHIVLQPTEVLIRHHRVA